MGIMEDHHATFQTRSDNNAAYRTPRRKSDQWRRLAVVVHSSQQKSVPGSNMTDVGLEVMSRSQRRCSLPSSPAGSSSSENYRVRKSFPLAVLPSSDVQNSPRKMRSLSSSYVSQTPNAKNHGTVYRTNRKDFSELREGSSSRKRRHEESSHKRKSARKSSDGHRVSSSDSYAFKYLKNFVLLLTIVAVTLVLSKSVQQNYAKNKERKTTLTLDDFNLLEKNFKENIFGQNIAIKVILDMIEKIVRVNVKPEEGHRGDVDGIKMVVLSLHGWTGVGKTFLTQLLIDSLDPENSLRFIIPIHFPHILNDAAYRKTIQTVITTNISQSAVNVVIFDEMDKASPSVIDGIAKTLSYIKRDKSYQNTTLIVLFVSNSLGQKINSHLFSLISQGRHREELTASDFDKVFRERQGHIDFRNHWYSVFTTHGLIDTFVPFLPLSLTHVKQCVEYNLLSKNVTPTSALVDKISSELSLFQAIRSDIQYSLTGCKRVAEKVDLHFPHGL